MAGLGMREASLYRLLMAVDVSGHMRMWKPSSQTIYVIIVPAQVYDHHIIHLGLSMCKDNHGGACNLLCV